MINHVWFDSPWLSIEEPINSYLTDDNTIAWWKCDELTNGTDIVDYSGNGYDLQNNGIQERNPNALFGYGIRSDGITDNCRIALTAAPLIQITQNITIEGFLYPEDSAKVGAAVYWGCMDNTQAVGWQLYSLNGTMYWSVRTNDNLFICSETHVNIGFTNGKLYHVRSVYDYTNSQIEIWVRNLTDGEQLVKVASLEATGEIVYNTGIYDWFTLAGNNAGASNHFTGTLDQISISDIVRTANYYEAQNIIPYEDGVINIGSRIQRYDSIHVNNLIAGSVEGDLDIAHTELNDMPSPSNTDHDGRYYTEAEVDALLAAQDTFLEMLDTPASYAAQSAKVPVVNTGETALIFEYRAKIENVARSIYVDHDTGSDNNGGTSWGDAFQTLQYAIDSIAPIIDGVNISVNCRGVFDEGSEEQETVVIKKVCAGQSQIRLLSDGYVGYAAVTGAASNYVEFAGSQVNDYFNDQYVWVDVQSASRLQYREITDTVQTAGTVRLYVTPNWTTTPSVGHRINISGLARIRQHASVTKQWRGLRITGSSTVVQLAGWQITDFDTGEPNGVYLTNGATLTSIYNFFIRNDNSIGNDMLIEKGAYANITRCYGVGSGAGSGNGLFVLKSASANFNRSQWEGKDVNINIANSSFASANYSGVTGGVTGVYITTGSDAQFSNDFYGNDGSSYGFYIDRFSTFSISGTNYLSELRELDLTEYNLSIKRTSTSAQPTPEVGEFRIWRDPDDNKTYLIYNDIDEGVRKVEMT